MRILWTIRFSGILPAFARLKGWLALAGLTFTLPAMAFEGQINATFTRAGLTNALKYIASADHLRIEVIDSHQPNPVNVVDRLSGELTLIFPHNHSYLRLPPVTGSAAAAMPGAPGMPRPPGVGPASIPIPGSGTAASPFPMPANLPPGIGPQPPSAPFSPGPGGGMPGMPGMPRAQTPFAGALPPPMMADQNLTLKATGQSTNILGFPCQQFELKGRGETVVIWATDELFAYQPYAPIQPRRLGPSMIEERWPGLVADRKLFPLIASGHFNTGAERFRFEVTQVSSNQIVEPDAALFDPPSDYHEIQPLPF